MEAALVPPSRTWQIVRIATIAALSALVVVLALSFRRDPQDIRTGTVGQPAPAFDLERLDAPGRVRLADLGGKVVVVNFFASWCVPCKEEAPALQRVWERYRTSGVVFVGIVYQDSPDAAKAFHERMGQTWPAAIDDSGRTALRFGVFGVPETYFIGKVVIVNFFASWCVPCKEEAPALQRVWERYRTSGVVFVGIVYQDAPDAAKAFHERMGQTWPAALDDSGRTALAFGVFGIPETYFIGKDGVIEGRHIGPIDEPTLIRGIDTLRSK